MKPAVSQLQQLSFYPLVIRWFLSAKYNFISLYVSEQKAQLAVFSEQLDAASECEVWPWSLCPTWPQEDQIERSHFAVRQQGLGFQRTDRTHLLSEGVVLVVTLR